jgi:signal peptidase I
MDTTAGPLGRHARRSFLLAMALGILSLVYVFIMPLAGVISLVLYFAVAWGIRKRRAGAALMCAAQFLLSAGIAAAAMLDPTRKPQLPAFAIAGIFSLGCAWLLLRAGLELRRDPDRSRPDWPWFAVIGATAVFWVCCGAYSMPSVSMQNTVMRGDYVLVDEISTRLGRDLRRGDLIVFHYPLNHDEVYIKRVVGIAGDRLRLVSKQLYRNGSAVPEPYALHMTAYEDAYRDNFPAIPNAPLQGPAMRMLSESVVNGELTVPQGKYFVLGDNRDDSADSRYWGFVDRSEIIGRPFLIYASYELKDQTSSREVRSVLNTRWNRLLKPL